MIIRLSYVFRLININDLSRSLAAFPRKNIVKSMINNQRSIAGN